MNIGFSYENYNYSLQFIIKQYDNNKANIDSSKLLDFIKSYLSKIQSNRFSFFDVSAPNRYNFIYSLLYITNELDSKLIIEIESILEKILIDLNNDLQKDSFTGFG